MQLEVLEEDEEEMLSLPDGFGKGFIWRARLPHN